MVKLKHKADVAVTKVRQTIFTKLPKINIPITDRPFDRTVLDLVGSCYGSCGKVRLEQLYDVILAPRTVGKEAEHHATEDK